MIILSLNKIIELKNLISENFGEKLHLHDTCGGQYFSLDNTNTKIQDFIQEYLAKQNLKADFSNNGLSFSIFENQ